MSFIHNCFKYSKAKGYIQNIHHRVCDVITHKVYNLKVKLSLAFPPALCQDHYQKIYTATELGPTVRRYYLTD